MNKGIPFWEQHIEKMVFGLAALVLLGVLAIVVLDLDAVTADIDNRVLGPAEVDEVMIAKARELSRKLQPDATADIEQFASVSGGGGEAYRQRLAGSTSPATAPPLIAPSLASVLLPAEVGSADVWYYQPIIPEPRIQPMVVQTIDTIQQSELDRVPTLSAMLDGESRDVIWTTPIASIDLAAIRGELEGQDSMTDPRRSQIPSNWYNRRPYFVDVVFERQAMGRDGKWGTAELVEPVPGMRSFREEIAELVASSGLDAGFRRQVWQTLDDKVQQLEIMQPDFYATKNDSFAEPTLFDDRAASGADEIEDVSDEEATRRQQQREIERRLRDRVNSAKRVESTLQELGGPMRQEDIDQAKGDGGGGSSGGGRGGGRGGDKKDPNGDPGFGSSGQGKKGSAVSATDQRRRLNLTLKLDRLKTEIQRLQSEFEALNPAAAAAMAGLDDESLQIIDVATDDEMLVWTHDLGVVPGASYRYRCRVLLYNPLFARSRQLLKAQQEFATAFTIESLTSDWSAPIEIKPPVEFYVVRATEDGGSMGLGEIRIEMYRYFNGSRRSEQFTVQPGEQIGRSATVTQNGEVATVDFSTDWYLVDVIADPAAVGGSGLDRDDDSTVVCRRIDGSEVRLRVPSRQIANPERVRLKMDVRDAQSS